MRTLVAGTALCACSAASSSGAPDAPVDVRPRDRIFIEAGSGDATRMYVVGFAREWSWRYALWGGVVTGYWEGSFGRWNSDLADGTHASAWVTQLGVTPVLRWQGAVRAPAWFVEAGIGANLLLPVYRSADKRFSTVFNFGDHLAVGHSFGTDGAHELALRFQHFSNAGIKHPNPGQNFVQVRYAWSFGR